MVESERVIEIGKVVGSYGVRGWLKLYLDSDLRCDRMFLISSRFSVLPLSSGSFRVFEVENLKRHGKFHICKFFGISDRSVSDLLRGYYVGVLYSCLPDLGAGEHYWCDLIGLEVRNLDGDVLGRVLDVVSNPGSDLLRIGSLTQDVEILIPFVRRHVLEVTSVGVVVDWNLNWI